MKTRWALLIAILILAALAWWRWGRTKNPTVVYRPVTVTRENLEKTIEATGEVSPLNRVEVKPAVNGRIDQLLVKEGDRVRSGQILGWMSSTDRAAILDAARSQGAEALKRWEDTYQPTPLRAPMTGTVILVNVVVGQTVDNGTVLFALSDRLITIAQVDEVDIGKIKLGQAARIVLDAYPRQEVLGQVFHILYEGHVVSNVVTYDVKVEPENPPPFFRSQMTANVKFILARADQALTLPANAIRKGPEGAREVLLAGPAGAPPVKQGVTLGLDTGDRVEIASGLTEGQTVLVEEKPYTPQKGQASSPLVMGGRPSSGQSGRPR